MAETQPPNPEPVATPPKSGEARPPAQKRGPPLHQIYALPTPIRTFPLPTFYPNNPISLFHVVYAWIGQVISPPAKEPVVVHQGVWSEATTSIHIADDKSTRALWEQGFYGKGSLSRSEPNWLKREQVRRGLQEAHVSEILTVQRREERARAKWERARLEQEVIRQTRLEEARQAQLRLDIEQLEKIAPWQPPSPPVSPAKLLALPNSLADLRDLTSSYVQVEVPNGEHQNSPEGVVADAASPETTHAKSSSQTLPNGSSKVETSPNLVNEPPVGGMNGSLPGISPANGKPKGDFKPVSSPSPSSDTSDSTQSSKRRKSVRFSPTVQSTTFGLLDPPSPNHSATLSTLDAVSDINGKVATKANGSISTAEGKVPVPVDQPTEIVNKEHLQLMPEEAFFLSFGLGALQVTDPTSDKTLTPMELFTLFRQHSYFPPRVGGPDEPILQPDDNFLVHYTVYHHFRSLGWVPRGGIKFGVDWLLYTRGPVFDHAEFGLIVVPSYSDPLWKESEKQNPQKTWQWLHGTVRVLSHVTKSLVLVYVDVPPPSKFDGALEKGFSEVFKLYKVREVMVKRWSSNRNR
ncbi:Fc.00g048480.m01.CDS01 [Cosmosporella sp. VM-42]